MPLADFPLNDQIAEWGFAWHGLHVVPASGAPYIELASGRRIYAADIGTAASPSTYLVDNGMPPVTTTLEDPEAALWSVAIVNGRELPYFNQWAGRPVAGRMVRVGTQWRKVSPNITNFGPYALLRAGVTGIADQQLSMAALGNVPNTFNTCEAVDISPDGRRWLLVLSQRENYASPYQIQISEAAYSGALAIVEVEFNAAVTAMTLRVVANYQQCAGVVISSSDGALFEQRIHFLRIGTTGIIGESDYAYVPGWTAKDYGEPESCSTYAGWPCSDSFRYATGTSTGKSVVEVVTGAWYDAAGVAQLLTLRIDSEIVFAKGSPAAGPGGRYYWDTFTFTRNVSVAAKVGGGTLQPYFDMQLIEQQTAMSNNFSLSLGQGAASFSSTSNHAVPTTHQTNVQVRQLAPVASRVLSMGILGASPVDIVVNLAHEASNKVRGALVRAVRADYCEYFASPCITPSGLDSGYLRTGNVWPGDRNDRQGFDLALWRAHANFHIGSHNPVTGQVMRNQIGGNRYAWV